MHLFLKSWMPQWIVYGKDPSEHSGAVYFELAIAINCDFGLK